MLITVSGKVRQFHSLGGDDTSAATVVLKEQSVVVDHNKSMGL